MAALITTAIIVASILAWVFIALCGIRASDIVSGGKYGIDDFDRGFVVALALCFAPIWLLGALALLAGRRVGSRGWIYDFTHPQAVKTKRKYNMRNQLLAEETKYLELARIAWNENRYDEEKLFRDVAKDYRQKANA